MIRVGAVSYLNTLPLVAGMAEGLGVGRVELSYAVPSALAEQMAGGELDIALLPIIELARNPDFEIVPGLGIVTRGASQSVLLVSRRPAEQIESVALDAESCTTNTLVQILLAEAWGRQPAFHRGPRDLDDALRDHDAAVRIGDKALFDPVPEGCHVYDLAEVWTQKTCLPFVFAAWAARPGILDREIYRILHESRRRGTRAIDRIARDYTLRNGRDPEVVRTYLTQHIHFRLGSAEVAAMKLFFRAAAELGLIRSAPEIRLAFGQKGRCHEVAKKQRDRAPDPPV